MALTTTVAILAETGLLIGCAICFCRYNKQENLTDQVAQRSRSPHVSSARSLSGRSSSNEKTGSVPSDMTRPLLPQNVNTGAPKNEPSVSKSEGTAKKIHETELTPIFHAAIKK